MVEAPPSQMNVGFAAAETASVLLTVRVTVLILLQFPVAPLMVYTVVDDGFSVCDAPVRGPGFQVKELAPDAVITVGVPVQIVALFTLMVGVGFTVNVPVELAVQEFSVPVTVYTTVDPGFSVCVPPLRLPGFQVYVLAVPEAKSVPVVPEQMVLDDTATTGSAFTVMVFDKGVDVPEPLEAMSVMVLVPAVA
jgi:hypothetical protein